MKPMHDDELAELIHTQATRHRASAALRAQVRTQLALAAARSAPSPQPSPQPSPRPVPVPTGFLPHRHRMGWRQAAGGFLAGVLLTAALLPLGPRPSVAPATLDEVLVADHVRSLQAGPLLQVQSTDRHTVKPWFQGRLDYAPPVRDLSDSGFPLLGARIEHIEHRAVAALVYGHRGHTVNLFVWPADTPAPPRDRQLRGFSIVQWQDADMQFSMVTDMDHAETERFVQAFQAHGAPR